MDNRPKASRQKNLNLKKTNYTEEDDFGKRNIIRDKTLYPENALSEIFVSKKEIFIKQKIILEKKL